MIICQDKIYDSNSWYSIAPELLASTHLKNGYMYFLSTEILNLATRLFTSSIVSVSDPFKSKSLNIFLSKDASFLASYKILDFTSLCKCFTVCLVISPSSFSGIYQVDSIILTKYSSLGVLMERSV